MSVRSIIANTLARLAGWLHPKGMPGVLAGAQWSGTAFVDSYRRDRAPTPNELMAELKNTAWTCASINASVCASFPPKLYVSTQLGQNKPKCATKAIARKTAQRLRNEPTFSMYTKAAVHIEEVVDHPLLDLFARCNPWHNGFDLWELVTLYLEVHGRAYWFAGPDEEPCHATETLTLARSRTHSGLFSPLAFPDFTQ
jgi:hypothetical protein